MKRVALGMLALAMSIAVARPAMGTPITGEMAIVGLDTYSLTGVTFLNPGLVVDANGSLAALLGFKDVDLNNFNFATAAGHVLFDWNHMATDIEATILSLNVMSDNNRFLNVDGTALLTRTGDAATKYDFSFTSTHTDGVTIFAFAAVPAATPEPGSLLLVGSGLLGLAGFLYRKAKKPSSTLPC